MTIKAKFASRCPSCGGRIQVGQEIEWAKGSPARHLSCGSKTGSQSAPRAPRQAGDCTEHAGVTRLSTPRLGQRDATVLLGQVFRAGKHCGPVANQVIYVVGAQTWYQSEEDNEDMGDMGGGGWGATRWVRLATPEESVPVIASEQARAKKIENARRLKEIVARVMSEGRRSEEDAESYQLPKGYWVHDRRQSTVGGVLIVEGSRVTSWDSGYYDDYRRSMGVVEDAALAAEVLALRTEMEVLS